MTVSSSEPQGHEHQVTAASGPDSKTPDAASSDRLVVTPVPGFATSTARNRGRSGASWWTLALVFVACAMAVAGLVWMVAAPLR